MQNKYLKYMPLWVSATVLIAGLVAVRHFASKDAGGDYSGLEVAVFGGGCFWGMERAFEGVEGVVFVVSGYSGGTGDDPTYEDYAQKGHTEVVRVEFAPQEVSYPELLGLFWEQIGAGCQLNPEGSRYRTAVFYHGKTQKKQAETSKESLERSGVYSGPVATEIREASRFYEAEEYHQDYHRKIK